jgi:hypothetical protein
MKTFKVRYYAGQYSGTRTVSAENSEEAIDKVRRSIRKEMTLPMCSDGYKVVEESEEEETED